MCRLIAYSGEPILLSDVIIKPKDSLIKQSLAALESQIPTNGDGFGLGWYVPEISTEPAKFLSIFPAWNDENLLHLAHKIKSHLFFAHVRAASTGGVNNYNCHPFVYKNWMFMHNGQIPHFQHIKKPLIELLDEDIYTWIRGQTDSEHMFALFLQLAKGKNIHHLPTMAEVLQATFKKIDKLLIKYAKENSCYYNICITDGKRILASRYCTNAKIKPESLYYLEGGYYQSEAAYLKKKSESTQCVIVASEKLTDLSLEWHPVPTNHFILVDQDYKIDLQPILNQT